jgi:anti-anti-sigma factor
LQRAHLCLTLGEQLANHVLQNHAALAENDNYIDSSGIGELVSAFTTVRKQGGDLKLLNLTKKVHDVLQITKLYTVFDVKDDEAGAIKSFNADAA